MTKEEIQYEAQSIIQEWGSNDSAPYVEFVEKLASMELPESFSNLDEAALKELQVYLPQGNGPDGICYFIAAQMLAMYKAGAEWMTGQDKEKNEQAFFSGYNECEERMKKELEKMAMAGEVNNTGYPTTIQLHTFDSSLKNGDKVNIIIMKQ